MRQLSFLLAFLFLILPLSSGLAIDCNDETSTTGTIEAIDSSSQQLTVNGIVIGVDGETRYRDRQGDNVSFSYFQVGHYVKVEYCPGAQNIATRVDHEDQGGTGCEFEIRGFIDSVDSTNGSLMIAGYTVLTTINTEYLDDDNNPISLSRFVVGVFAEAEGCVDGMTLTAEKLKIEDESGDDNFEFEFKGLVDSIDATAKSLVVSGVTVTTGPATRFYDDDNNPVTFDAFTVGEGVEVKGTRLANGSIFASEIDEEDDVFTGFGGFGSSERRGFISAFGSDNTLVVGGTIVHYTASTQFLGRRNEPISFSVFLLGDFVEAEGQPQADGSLLASKIKLEDAIALSFELRGTISEISGDAFVINGSTVRTNSRTVFLDRNNQPVAASAFVLGNFVEAEGFRYPSESGDVLIAEKIKLEDGPGAGTCVKSFEFIGEIESVEGNNLVVGGRTVLVQANTELKDVNNLPTTLAAFTTGIVVKVEGNFATNDTINACEVKVHAGTGTGVPAANRLFGTIQAVDSAARTLMVGNASVTVDPNAIIQSRLGAPIELTGLRVGMLVEVRGGRLANGTFHADFIRVQLENVIPGDREVRLEGIVTAADVPNSITVDSTVVSLAGNPTVTTFDGQVATTSNIAVGDRLKVEGSRQQDGSVLARVIEVRASLIGAIDGENLTFTVANVTVAVVGATELRELGGATLAFADFNVGDLVKVEGDLTTLQNLTARQVTRLEAVEFSGAIAGFSRPQSGTPSGRPTLTATSNVDAFGFAQVSQDALANSVSSIYEVRMNVSTNVADRSQVPQARLRVNNQSLQKGAYVAVDSQADGRFSPTAEGTDYTFYFVPAQKPADATIASDDWFAAMDLLNFEGLDAANGALTLEAITTQRIDASRIVVEETLVEHDFTVTSQGWYFAGSPEAFTLPIAGSGRNGTLDLAATDHTTFGFWTTNTRVTPEAGQTYRGRFHVRASSADRSKVPTFRVRLNLSRFQLASVIAVESIGAGDESPDALGRIYDVYLFVPSATLAGETILASFDLLNFTADDALMSAVSLDHFKLERVSIAE